MMYEYAFVQNEQVVFTRSYKQPLAADHPKILSGVVRPIVTENAEYNPATHVRSDEPQIIVEPTRVIRRYSLRPKDSAEVEIARNALLRGVRFVATRKVEDVISPGETAALLVMGLEGILNHGLAVGNWPAALRNAFVPLATNSRDAVKAIYAVLKAKEDEIALLTTAEEIAIYDISVGWP